MPSQSKKSKTKPSPLEKIESIVKRYLLTASIYAVIMAAIGIFMIIFPELSLDIIRWSLVVVLISLGVYAIVSDLMQNSVLTMFTGSIGGVLMLVLGVIIAMHPGVLSVIPVILGVFIIVSATFSLRLSTSLRAASATGFFISMLTSVVAIICGIILILNPLGGALALTTFVGIMLTIYAVVSLVDIIVFRAHMQELADNLKFRLRVGMRRGDVVGGEVDEDDD